MAGADDLIRQFELQAARASQPSPFEAGFQGGFQRSFNQGQDLVANQQMLQQKLQQQLQLESFRQQFKQQQNEALIQSLAPQRPVSQEAPGASDLDAGEGSALEKKMGSIQQEIDKLTVFAGNPVAKAKIDSLREDQKRVQKRIDRLRDRKIKREDAFEDRLQNRVDKLTEIEGSIPISPEELEGLTGKEKLDFVNERIRLSKRPNINGTDAVRLQSAKSFVKKSEELKNILKETGVGTELAAKFGPSRAFSPTAQKLDKVLYDLSDRLLRARTGATARTDEVNNTKKLFLDLFSADAANVASIESFIEEMNGLIQNLETGKATSDPNMLPAPTINSGSLSTPSGVQFTYRRK